MQYFLTGTCLNHMKNYEVTFIVDSVLSGDDIKATAQAYVEFLKKEGCNIVHIDEMGLRQLAYPINKRTTGVYYCIEFEAPTGALIADLELQMRRDERLLRFLTVKLDKYGVKYNKDKREGRIGKKKKKDEAAQETAAPAPKARAAKKAAEPAAAVAEAKTEEE
ncbi:30S ribosomal protein S6 [Profundibacter sp.]